MAIINGYLENLLDDNMLEDPEMTRRFLSVMRKHADRISRIVEDMLVISRLESGEASSLKVEPFRFRSCIKDILERLESVIRNQNAAITVTMSDETLTLHGDRFYWTQVLFNLVENALKQNPHPASKSRSAAKMPQTATASGSPTTASASPAPISPTSSADSIESKNITLNARSKALASAYPSSSAPSKPTAAPSPSPPSPAAKPSFSSRYPKTPPPGALTSPSARP